MELVKPKSEVSIKEQKLDIESSIRYRITELNKELEACTLSIDKYQEMLRELAVSKLVRAFTICELKKLLGEKRNVAN